MTVIAYDGKTISADKRATNGGLCRTVTKLYRLTDGSVAAFAGGLANGTEMKAWLEAGADPEKFPESQKSKDDWNTFIHHKNGLLMVYETSPQPLLFEDRLFASGSGRDFALAAMHCGRSTAEAVEIASLFENGCGNGVDTLEIN